MGTYTQNQADVAANAPSPMASINWGTGIHEMLTGPIGGVEGFMERIFILPGLKTLDQRAKVLDNLNNMEQNVITLKRN